MSNTSGVAEQVLSLPKGGGALQGIGETFQPNLFSGTGNHTIPIAASPGRNGFGPALTLQYSSGNGNGPFGFGWQLSIPRITRKTEKGLPRYDDTDIFVMSGAEDLVPCLKRVVDPGSGEVAWVVEDPIQRQSHTVYRYRPRTEGLFARIERWQNDTTEEVHWRAISKDNVSSIYGAVAEARIADAEDPRRVYEWLLQETFDAYGNHILYEYARDDPDAAPDAIFEQNRKATQLYVRRICYGNLPSPLLDEQGNALTYPDGAEVGCLRDGRRYAFEMVFDYGDWDLPTRDPHPEPLPIGQQELFGPDPSTSSASNAVPIRPDRFSTYQARFEVRTLRRCRRVLMFHHFAELGGPTLVRSTDLAYHNDPDTLLSLLTAVTVTGHRRNNVGTYVSASLPPVTFRYSQFKPHEQRYQTLTARGDDLPPTALSDPDMALVDLFGDGLPDVVRGGPAGFRYWRNLGSGLMDRPRSMPHIPAGLALSQAGVGFADMGGDGRVDLLVHAGALHGFFETTSEGSWQTFKPYEVFPTFDLADPNVRMVDLTGDGLTDALMTAGDRFLWFQCLGEKGFGLPEPIARKHDPEAFPDVFFDDPAGRVRLANMSGGGLNDIVLVHNDRIEYWPNLGYGRFGRRITMENAPHLGVDFDPKRLFLVDLNGTGCADLVYVEASRVHFWFNQCGNRWSSRQTIFGTPGITDLDSVEFADVFGTGTTTLLWSYDFATHPEGNYKALDFCGGIKPYVLTETSNNMGATTRVSYVPSTRYFLEDLANGTPWLTHLPFPVQVVDKVEVIDHISRTKLVTRYKYHHGYFDGGDREFRGFGRVDQFDTETFEDFTGSSLHGGEDSFDNGSSVFHAPPIETRTWFHTGIYFNEDSSAEVAEGFDHRELTNRFRKEFYRGDGEAIAIDEHDVDAGVTPRDAYRTLRGAVLRTELYAHDETADAEHPYEVTENRYRIVQLQPESDSQTAVYLSHTLETLCHHYERKADDPRVIHALTLQVDAFGNPLKIIAVNYGRRQPDPALPSPADRDAQTLTSITYAENRYTNALDDPLLDGDNHLAPLPVETRTFELTGFEPEGNASRFTFDEWVRDDFARLRDASEIAYEESPTAGVAQKRLIEHVRTCYRANDLSGLLSLGKVESLALPGETYKLALTQGLLAQVYGNRVSDAMLEAEGGYVHSEGDTDWWIPSARVFYSPDPTQTPAEELSFARQRFFLPHRHRDPFGQIALIRHDAYALLLRSTSDPLGNRVSAEHDYYVLQPFRTTDPNGNRAEVAFDTLGLVSGTAMRGKVTETKGDSMAGFAADLTDQQIDSFLADPLGTAASLLGAASTRVIYSLHRYRTTGEAAFAAVLARETHSSDPVPVGGLKVQVNLSYSDGFGREVQRKTQVEPGPITPDGPIATPRWLATAWTIFNNKGKPVRQYEPFFDDTHGFRFGNKQGVSSTLFYDPVERVVATLHPNHTWEKVLFDPWRRESWDVNDTVVRDPSTDPDVGTFFRRLPSTEYLPTWHGQRVSGALGPAEHAAAESTAIHAATPSVTHSDALGRAFLTTSHNRFEDNGITIEEQHVTRTILDIEGNPREVIDAKDRVAMRSDYDMLGSRLHDSSMDAGERWTLFDVVGHAIYSWNNRGQRFRTAYDERRRPIAGFLQGAAGPELLVGRTVYGESTVDPEAANLRDKVVQTFDQSGLITSDQYDFKGNLTDSRRQLAREYKEILDWSASPELEPEIFASIAAFDALNRPVSVTSPDQSVYRLSFSAENLIKQVDVHLRGAPSGTRFVNNIEYDSKGQRVLIEYGNGVRTQFEYDPLTLRLARLTTLRGSESLQDLAYTHDAIGNVTQIADAAQQTIYFGNQVVRARNRYVYDAVYRLIFAEGREHIGQAAAPATSWDDHFRVRLPHPGDGQAMRHYTERYEYDPVGNILTFMHRAANGDWTRSYVYDEPSLLEPAKRSNRLSATQLGADPPDAYQYDQHGNMLAMPHLPQMEWSYRDALHVANLAAGGAVVYVYDATGHRVRKVVERNGAPIEERIYFGGFEIFRKRQNGSVTFEQETLHVMDDALRVATVETRTIGADGSPEQLTRYQLGNHLGSALLELDHSADIVSYEEYYPYGSTSYQAVRRQTETPKRYRYTGMERDELTGLSYHGSRYYAPWIGRWTSADPASLADGTNLYRYVRNNPVALTDPAGTEPKVNVTPGNLIDVDELRAMGVKVAPEDVVSTPSLIDPWVAVENQDEGRTDRLRLSQVRGSPDYIDNAIVSVTATLEDIWTLGIDSLRFRYTNKPDILVPLEAIDFGPTATATKFIKSQGVIIPVTDDQLPALDAQNTPTILAGARMKLEDQAAARGQRLELARITFAFTMMIASLGAAAAGLPEGRFISTARPPPRGPASSPTTSAAGSTSTATSSELSSAGIVQALERHKDVQNARIATAILNGNRGFFRNLGMSEKQIAILMRGRGRWYPAQYGNALERALGRAVRSDPKLSGMVTDARYLSGRIFPTRVGLRPLRPDFGFSSGPLQGHIVDLTTAGGRAAKMAKYHDRVLVLEYMRP